MCVQELMTYFSTSPYKGPSRQAPSCCSLAKSCPVLFDQGPSLSVEFAQTHVHGVGDTISFLCCPLLLLPSIFPSFMVFSSESVLHIRGPKYWSCSFSISPSNEYSGLISLGLTGWISLQSRDSQESSPTPQFKSINSWVLSFPYIQSNSHIHT